MFDQEFIGFDWPTSRCQASSLRPYIINAIAPVVVAAGIAAAASVAGAALSSGAPSGGLKPKVLPKTVSGSQMQDFDILYDMNAIQNMYNVTDQLAEMAAEDRAFFDDVYKPFQERMAQMNQEILPTIEKTSQESLEAITRTLVSGEAISKIMTEKATKGLGTAAKDAVSAFRTQLNDLPTESERVGQALTNVESAFGASGKQLVRDFQSRGQTVSQASKRDLLMEKAKAKAGAAGLASEASRAERLNAAERGAGLELQVEGMEAGFRTQAAQTATAVGGLAQNAAGAAQQALLKIDPITGLETKQTEASLRGTLSQQQFGTRGLTDTIEHTQKGIKQAQLSSGAGGAPGGRTVGGVGGVSGTTGEPARDAQGNLITTGTSGGFQAVSGGKFDTSGNGIREFATSVKMGKTIEFGGDQFHVQDDGKIVNLQTGGILNSSIKGDDATKYDTDKAIKFLTGKAEQATGSSTLTHNVRTPRAPRPADNDRK